MGHTGKSHGKNPIVVPQQPLVGRGSRDAVDTSDYYELIPVGDRNQSLEPPSRVTQGEEIDAGEAQFKNRYRVSDCHGSASANVSRKGKIGTSCILQVPFVLGKELLGSKKVRLHNVCLREDHDMVAS